MITASVLVSESETHAHAPVTVPFWMFFTAKRNDHRQQRNHLYQEDKHQDLLSEGKREA